MTGPEHYRRAEQLLATATELMDNTHDDVAAPVIAVAQVHATLALAAATARNDSEVGLPTPDFAAWADVAGVEAGGAS